MWRKNILQRGKIYLYIPPFLMSLIATQKSCRGLGSNAKAQDDKAKKDVKIK